MIINWCTVRSVYCLLMITILIAYTYYGILINEHVYLILTKEFFVLWYLVLLVTNKCEVDYDALRRKTIVRKS